MGEPQTPLFYDFGIFGHVPRAPKPFILSLETPGSLNKIKKKSLGHSKHIIFGNLKIAEIRNSDKFRKEWHRQMMKIRPIKSWKSWNLASVGGRSHSCLGSGAPRSRKKGSSLYWRASWYWLDLAGELGERYSQSCGILEGRRGDENVPR